jgi:hypothetical protein
LVEGKICHAAWDFIILTLSLTGLVTLVMLFFDDKLLQKTFIVKIFEKSAKATESSFELIFSECVPLKTAFLCMFCQAKAQQSKR